MNEAEIVFDCEFCGDAVVLPVEYAGTCEVCPHCFEYIDIPSLGGTDSTSDEHCDAYQETHIEVAGHPLVFDLKFGFPHPRWREFIELIDENASHAQLIEIFDESAAAWLNTMLSHLPSGYKVSESEEFYLLTRSPEAEIPMLLEFCEHARNSILQMIDEAASDEGIGKHVVLNFAETATYYSYTSVFMSEGAHGGSVGMFINDDYPHIVTQDGFDWQRTLAHELTHCLMRHLPLPMWLNEGVTQIVEDHLFQQSLFQPDSELKGRLLSYWKANEIGSFWNGDSFHFPDDGQELSYVLARVLVWRLSTDFPQSFWTFVGTAEWNDAGSAAALNCFNRSLGEFLLEYLGAGDWEPQLDESDS